jgi:hypothetical protein
MLDVETPRLGDTPQEHDEALAGAMLEALPDSWRFEGLRLSRVPLRSPWAANDELRERRSRPESPPGQPESDETGRGRHAPPANVDDAPAGV